ncbi:MAG: adenosylcobinamide-GDP ribazoletransferase [Rikenellaceae bacterium]
MNILFNAFLYHSRIPVPRSTLCTPETLSRSLRYFPLVGIVVGAIGWCAYWLVAMLLPHNIAVMAAMAAMLLSTGALHEDGFADFCDGFGGGYTKEAILRIMKDSHIGTYGVIGLIMVIGVRYLLLCSFEPMDMLKVFIVAQGASRFAPVVMVRTSTYARSEPSKSSHSALKLSLWSVVIAMVLALAPLALFGWEFAASYVGVMSIIFVGFRAYIYKHIEGFTGDTLGALQQIGEVAFYTTLLAFQM